jgi:hypothetical protein
MTIKLENGWVQWDGQIGTYRAEINGTIYGTHTGHLTTVEELQAAIPVELTEAEQLELIAEKGE